MIVMIVTLALLIPPNQHVLPHVPSISVVGQSYPTLRACDQDIDRATRAVTAAIARTHRVSGKCG